jgi:DNA-binding beta-propeller fold protein YncE
MKRIFFAAFMLLLYGFAMEAQSDSVKPLKLIATVPMPGITGDFDHFAVDLEGKRLFLVAEGHKSVEVFDLQTGKTIHSIPGFDEPHAVLYRGDVNEIFVSDGGGAGACKILTADTFKPIKSIPLHPDADPISFDPETKMLYVASGGRDGKLGHSVLSIIDTSKNELVGEIKVNSVNIEAMAGEKSGPRLFVNVRDHNQIAIVDRAKQEVTTTWNLEGVERNTPMALDEPDHRLFIVGRKPGKLAVLDSDSGKMITTVASSDGADDMWFDSERKRIYVSGAEGFIDVFSQKDPDHYEAIAKIPTGFRAKMSVLVPTINRFYVAVSQHESDPASLMIFSVQ